jgi:hypothetical protein
MIVRPSGATASDVTARSLVELRFEAKSGAADVDRDAPELTIARGEKCAEILNDAWYVLRHSKKLSSDVDAFRIVVDHSHRLPRSSQHRRNDTR